MRGSSGLLDDPCPWHISCARSSLLFIFRRATAVSQQHRRVSSLPRPEFAVVQLKNARMDACLLDLRLRRCQRPMDRARQRLGLFNTHACLWGNIAKRSISFLKSIWGQQQGKRSCILQGCAWVANKSALIYPDFCGKMSLISVHPLLYLKRYIMMMHWRGQWATENGNE